MKEIVTYIKEGFYNSVGSDKYFSKSVCDNTYKYYQEDTGYPTMLYTFHPSGIPNSTQAFNIASEGIYGIDVTCVKGFMKYRDKDKHIHLNFEPFIKEIERDVQDYGTPLEDLRLSLYPYPHRSDILIVELKNSRYQIISFYYTKEKGLAYGRP